MSGRSMPKEILQLLLKSSIDPNQVEQLSFTWTRDPLEPNPSVLEVRMKQPPVETVEFTVRVDA